MLYEWKNEIARENYKLYRDNAMARRAWEIDAMRFDDFRYQMHFSRAEEAEMLAFRQAPLPISITTAICDTAEALMVSSKPTIRVAPIINPFNEANSETSRKIAQIYNYVIQKDWYDSLGALQYDRVVRDYTNVGVGYFYVVPRMEFGEFKVDIKHLSWRYVYPHSQSKDPFLRDMDNCIIAMWISEEYGYKLAKAVTPDLTFKDFQEDFVKGSIKSIAGGVEPPARYSPHFIKNKGMLFDIRLVKEEQNAFLIIPKDIPAEKINESMVRFSPELTDQMKQDAKEGKIEIRNVKKFFTNEYQSIGNQGFKKTYAIDDYNIIPMYYDHRDTPYPYGRIWYLYPLQRAINKMVMLAILNGSVVNTGKIIAEDGSITNEAEFKQNFAMPFALLKWNQKVAGMTKAPQVVEGKPLGEAWLRFPQYLAYIMEYISGIFGTMMGDSRESPNVFSTVAALQSAGGQKIKRRLAQADASLSVVGEIVGKFYKEYAPLNGYAVSINNETGEMEAPVVYNRLRQVNGDKVKTEVEPETDLSFGFRSVRFTTQASNGFEAGTEAALLTNMATQLKVPALIPLILKRLNIPDVDKVMEQLDLIGQQGQQIEQLQQVIQDLESRTKVLASQVTQKGFEVSKAQFDGKFKEFLAELKNNPEMMIQLTQAMEGQNGKG